MPLRGFKWPLPLRRPPLGIMFLSLFRDALSEDWRIARVTFHVARDYENDVSGLLQTQRSGTFEPPPTIPTINTPQRA